MKIRSNPAINSDRYYLANQSRINPASTIRQIQSRVNPTINQSRQTDVTVIHPRVQLLRRSVLHHPLQVLSRDIRSLRQRTKIFPIQKPSGSISTSDLPTAASAPASSAAQADAESDSKSYTYFVIIENIQVAYDLDVNGRIVVRGGQVCKEDYQPSHPAEKDLDE